MKKILCFIYLLPIVCCAQIPSGYYAGTENLNGYQLKTKLNKIISQKTISWNYGDLPEFYKTTDRDLYYENDSSILDIYAENPIGTDAYNYTYENPSLISGASEEGEGWNREHSFSQSFFFSNYPMYSDLNFIYPADARVNQRRSNFPFAIVNNNPTFTSLNGGKVGLSATPGYTLTVFEPIDEFKGDVARMLFYVAVLYENLLPLFDTANKRNPFGGKAEIALRSWLLPLLKQWNQQDPVSQREIDRNNKIFTIQGNRNPFIDHPEWIQLIWNDTVSSIQEVPSPAYFQISKKGKHFVTVEWDPNQIANAIGFELYRNDTLVDICKNNSYTFSGLSTNTEYNFSIRAYDQYYNYSQLANTIITTTLSSDTFSSDLYFSKYIEGSSNNHALEITNKTGYTVDLRHYYISIRQYNSQAEQLYWSDNKYQMEGTLSDNRKIVILHPEWNLECFSKDSADFVTASTPLTFDGSLAIDLRRDSFTIDQIGNPYSHDTIAQNVSLYRYASISQPNPNYDSAEWHKFPIDYCDSLGNITVIQPPVDTPSSVKTIDKKHLTIYPNPVSDGRIFVNGEGIQYISEVRLVTIMGQSVKEWQHPFLTHKYLDVSNIKAGLYILILDNVYYKILIE